jgi:hypothetical protein
MEEEDEMDRRFERDEQRNSFAANLRRSMRPCGHLRQITCQWESRRRGRHETKRRREGIVPVPVVLFSGNGSASVGISVCSSVSGNGSVSVSVIVSASASFSISGNSSVGFSVNDSGSE